MSGDELLNWMETHNAQCWPVMAGYKHNRHRVGFVVQVFTENRIVIQPQKPTLREAIEDAATKYANSQS